VSAPAAPPGGGPDPRMLWPNILEAVKNRRRFTWILLSQNAQVTGFDGTTLHIGFVNVGARDNFASSGSEEVLRQALAELFNVQWKIEAVIDPSGGSAPPPAPGAGFGGFAGNAGGGSYAPGGASHQDAPRPAPQQPAAPASRPSPSASQNRPMSGGGPSSASAHQAPSRPSPQESPPISPEDDIPEEDDPDLDESALSGHELIVRELGATVVEEYANE